MKAVRLHGIGTLRVEQPELPATPGGWVRIRVISAGICGSDLHNFQQGRWFAGEPVTPGHELFGVVEENPDPGSVLVPGQRIVADSRVWCGECPACQREAYNLCEHLGFVGEVFDGGFAQYVVLPLKNVLPVPDDVPDDIAVLSEPLGVALRVVNQLGVAEGAHVRVAGGGTIGGLAALLLHRLKHCRVCLQEPNAQRYQLLSSLIPFDEQQPYSYAVEATGKETVLSTLVDNITSGGRIAMVGIFHQTAQLDVNALVEREITLVGCSVFQDEQRQALALMASLASELRAIMAPPVPLDAVPEAYQQLIAGNSAWLKAVIVP